MKKNYLLMAMLFASMSMMAEDGDIFTSEFTSELGNFELRFTVLSEAEHTCMVGVKYMEGWQEWDYNQSALVDASVTPAVINIPAEVKGYKVTEIGKRAFNSASIESITIPPTVEKIHDQAFESIPISKLEIPASVTSIGKSIAGHESLKEITVDAANTVYDSRNGCNAIVETATNTLMLGCSESTIVDGIEVIGADAFMGGEVWYIESGALVSTIWGIRDVHIPKSVKVITDNPFSWGMGIEKITVDADNPVFDSRSECNAIINTATGELVVGCKNTVVPDGVTRIGKNAFSGMRTGLAKIDLPESVISIGSGAFYKCEELKAVSLPEGLQTIEFGAFQQSGLEKVTIPSTVTSIDEQAFFICNGLSEVTSLIMQPFALGSLAFAHEWNTTTLYVPSGTKALYEITEGWSNFKNIVEIDESTPVVSINGIREFAQPQQSVYSLTGVPQQQLNKGLYIICGKKVLVK